jgi:hypothetical protein
MHYSSGVQKECVEEMNYVPLKKWQPLKKRKYVETPGASLVENLR